MENCNNLCTADKCAELEREIILLKTQLETLKIDFANHIAQNIPDAHQYQPNLNISLNIEDNWLYADVRLDGVSDSTQVKLSEPFVTVDVFETGNNQYAIKVSVDGDSDTGYLTIDIPEVPQPEPTFVAVDVFETGNNQFALKVTVDGDSDTDYFAIDLPEVETENHVKSNLKGNGSFYNDRLNITISDGESSDSFNIPIPLSDLVSTTFIKQTNNMNCDELEQLIINLGNNLTNQLITIQDAVTVDISGSTPSNFSCPEVETNPNNTPLNYGDVGLKGLHQLTKSINDNLLSVFANTCNEEAVLAAPDWWQVRVGANRPQIVCTFRKGSTRTYHSITIPHPANVDEPTNPLLPEYQKGNWQGMIVLKDNSKFIINCATKAEAETMCNLAASLIKPEFLPVPFKIWLSERKGEPVGEDQMFPTTIMYYSTGQQDLMPDWRVSVTNVEN